jgi:DNA processing protein
VSVPAVVHRDPAGVATVRDRSVEIAAAALIALDHMHPARLRALMDAWPDPRDAVAAIRTERAVSAFTTGDEPRRRVRDPRALVRGWSTRVDLAGAAHLLSARRARVLVAGTDGYPIDTGIDDHPRALFVEGTRPDAFAHPCVGVVGTRAATPHGLADARELGAALAGAGVTVVSGLAIGIDGAAHDGALAAGGVAVGVVATGLDVAYPRRHDILHQRVRAHGLLVSEHRYGTGPHPARFPVRNRIIAALSDVLVVVEATADGGSRITADQAIEYGRDVCAYPASRRNASGRGSNELLRAGAHVVIEPADVLGLLGLTAGDRRAPAHSGDGTAGATREERAVLGALGGEPATVDDLTARTGLEPGPVAIAVAGLVRSGHLDRAHGLLWPR